MTITVQLPAHIERRLRARAAARGVELAELVADTLSRSVAEEASSQEPPASADDIDEEAAPWRGVFTVTPERQELFPNGIPELPGGLHRWQPEIILNPAHFDDDDE